MQLFSNQHFERLDSITLDYTYQNLRKIGDRFISHISSTSDKYHYQSLQDFMLKDLIPNNYDIFILLQHFDTLEAQKQFALLGDMTSRRVLGDDMFQGFEGFVCPKKLSESQILRLRLWYEYSKVINSNFSILAQQTFNFETYETEQELKEYFNEQRILDDNYILSLMRKYPNDY